MNFYPVTDRQKLMHMSPQCTIHSWAKNDKPNGAKIFK